MEFTCPNCEHHLRIAESVPPPDLTCPSCGSLISSDATHGSTLTFLSEVQALAHFELLHAVGSGQFGTVWKARDTKLNRIVAIKAPHKNQLSPEDVGFIMREARLAGQLDHPNIVTVHDVIEDSNALYIVSQFIDGATMSHWLKNRRFTDVDVAQLLVKICRAVHFAHEKGIVHRDLKPTNILMDAEGNPYITDFGLAKREKVETTISIDGHILGTPAYMSPEQARGEGQRADRRSDVYSLGVILYEMLVGERPFKGGSQVLLEQVKHSPPPSPRSKRKSISLDLETICLKSLEKDPDRRYGSAEALTEDLERFVNGEPIQARPISWLERTTRRIKREPQFAGFLSLSVFGPMVIVLLAMLIFDVFGTEVPIDLRPPAGTRQVSIETNSEDAKVTFYPMSAVGTPLIDQAVERGQYNGETWLAPGYYWVVAYESDQRFHEVIRFVPGFGDVPLPFRFAVVDEDSDTGILSMSSIELFDQATVTDGMVSITGGTFQYAMEAVKTVNDFLVAPTEFPDPERPNWPEVGMSWGAAVDTAEDRGQRLLFTHEHVYVATAGGTRRFPSGDDGPTEDQWITRPFGSYPEDVLTWERADGEVQGLFSNPLEWTIGFQKQAQFLTCFFVGGPNGDPPKEEDITAADPRDRIAYLANLPLPRVGFRAARSLLPFGY